jgi:hypothetical protein
MRFRRHLAEDFGGIGGAGGYGIGYGPAGTGMGRGSGSSLVTPNDADDNTAGDSLKGELSDVKHKANKVISLLKSGSIQDAAKKAVALFFRYGKEFTEELDDQMSSIDKGLLKGWDDAYKKAHEAYKNGDKDNKK